MMYDWNVTFLAVQVTDEHALHDDVIIHGIKVLFKGCLHQFGLVAG